MKSVYDLDRETMKAYLAMSKAQEAAAIAEREYQKLKRELDNRLEEDQTKFELKEC